MLQKLLRRTVGAVGSSLEMCESASELSACAPAELVVLDARRRGEVDWARLAAWGAKVIVVGESLEKEEVLGLLGGNGIDHVVGPVTDVEEMLVITSGKMARKDIFGLEKYLAWGALVHERLVRRYEEKRDVLLGLAVFAEELGVRRQVVSRIEAVADELLMNALYDAPALRYGVMPQIAERARRRLGPLGDEPAVLRWACDGRQFALSVQDNYGELRKEAILSNLLRARAGRGAAQATPGGGAGLGLYFVVSRVSGLVANIAPGQLSELIALFDVKATGRESEGYARSLQIFTT